MKYYKQSDDEWVQPKMNGYLMACCDCGLVHKIDFRIVGNKVQFRATRNKAETNKIRKTWTKNLTKKQKE